MKNLIIAITALLLIGITTYILFNPKTKIESEYIPENYIAVFHGENKGIIFETYIYKVDNKQANMGFNYINTVTVKTSKKIKTTIAKQGEVTWTDDVFPVAKKHGAYDYVTMPNSDKQYSIEDFQILFLMN